MYGYELPKNDLPPDSIKVLTCVYMYCDSTVGNGVRKNTNTTVKTIIIL